MRSVLDGHIYLSRQLAGSGHYPAIDIDKSISRVMINVVNEQQVLYANYFKNLYSMYSQNKDIVNVGMYHHGADKVLDEAIKYKDSLERFLRQSVNESYDMNTSVRQLFDIFVKA